MSARTDGDVSAPPPAMVAMSIPPAAPDGLTWCDYLLRLLRVASSIEHALMVQYLFAAYSLDPEKRVDGDERRMIAGWQHQILSVAKEEMGHLLTVQNVLCLLGAKPCFKRESAWPFKLERLTMDSLTQYLWVEMPDGDPALLSEVKLILGTSFDRVAHKNSEEFHTPHVGQLYRAIIAIISDPAHIPDDAFRHDSFQFQASWDDWGRGHNYKTTPLGIEQWLSTHRGALGATNHANWTELQTILLNYKNELTRADVIIERAATRSQAIDALTRVSEQGEAAKKKNGSHLIRFAMIMKDFDDALGKDSTWQPAPQVADDPYVILTGEKESSVGSPIRWPLSRKWAGLFNLRYRMLLTYLSHTFQIAADGNQGQLRGTVIHKVFGEMYNLKAIAGILVRLPLDDIASERRAGPPFQMPASLELPQGVTARWRLHSELIHDAIEQDSDLIEATLHARDDLRGMGLNPEEHLSFLHVLRELDGKSAEWTDRAAMSHRESRVSLP